MLRRFVLPLALLGVLSLSSCNTDVSQDDDDDPDITVVRAGLSALYAGDHATASTVAEGDCFADALLDRLTPEELVTVGVVGDSGDVVAALPMLDVPTAEIWVDAQFECTDFIEASTRALLAQSKGKLAQDIYGECLRDALTEDELRAALVQTLSGGFESPEVTALSEAQATCAKAALPAD